MEKYPILKIWKTAGFKIRKISARPSDILKYIS